MKVCSMSHLMQKGVHVRQRVGRSWLKKRCPIQEGEQGIVHCGGAVHAQAGGNRA